MRAVNLIPSDDRGGAGITAGRSGGGVIVIAGLLAGLAVLALLYGLADHQISSNRSEVASLTARAQQAQTRAGELAPYTSFLQMREQRVQAVTTLVDSRFDWAQAFQELGRVLPAGKVALGSIEGTVGSTTSASSSSSSSAASGSSVTSATPPGSIPVFKLTGCAVSQAEVALVLERLRLIDGVNEVSLQSSIQSAASASGTGSGGGCAGGNPAFTAQVTFDALPAISAAGAGTGTGTSTSTAASTSTATSSGATATSAPASTPPTTSTPTATTTSTPVASAASASSSGPDR